MRQEPIKPTDKLSGKARAVIDQYLALPVGGKPSCPYFNNRRKRARGSLRTLIGKGSPYEIAEECEILSKLSRVKIADLSTDKLKEFLVESDLGVDCSGFAYHVLNSFCNEKTGKNIQSYVKSIRPGFVGGLLARLRPAENIGVSSFRAEKNSSPIKVTETQSQFLAKKKVSSRRSKKL